MNNTNTTIIAGGGLGGLFCGALLARNNHRVTILEKNHTVGGGLQTFRRHGLSFDTGMHVLGGFKPGGTLRRVCDYLGITSRLPLRDCDDDCMDSVTYASDGRTYRLPAGREQFVSALCSYFPDEADAIGRYVDRMYDLASQVDLFRLRPAGDTLAVHSADFFIPADTFIHSYLTDPRLRDVAAYMNPLYDGRRGHTPAYIHAIISALYIDGSCRIEGGSDMLTAALTDLITSAGGTILTNSPVVEIPCDKERGVECMITADGRQFIADNYIFAAFPEQLNELMTGYRFPAAFRHRMADIPVSVSVFTLYITFRPDTFPYINHTCYWQADYGMVWDHAQASPTAPRGFMYITPPEANQGAFATKMIVSVLCPFAEVEQWRQTTTPGRRGHDYLRWKSQCTEAIMERLRTIFPDIDRAILHIDSASPLTVRDYYGIRDGSMYGYLKDTQNIMLSQMNVHTRLHNLFLTGQNIHLHGICGVPLTAIETAEAILGTNSILNNL